jgi:hypothetical protein
MPVFLLGGGDHAQIGFLGLHYPLRRWAIDLGFVFPEVARKANLAAS